MVRILGTLRGRRVRRFAETSKWALGAAVIDLQLPASLAEAWGHLDRTAAHSALAPQNRPEWVTS
jgi:hypothetical protein